MTITDLSDISDQIRVKAQGSANIDADWQPCRVLDLTVPVHVGKKYMIGQSLEISIKSGRKP